MRHYCLGGCSAPSVCARRSRPVRGGSGRYLVLCLSRFPHPALRVPLVRHSTRSVRAASSVRLPFWYSPRALCVCVRSHSRGVRFPPPWVVWRAHLARSRHWALVGPFHVVRAPPRVLPRSLAPSGVLGGGVPVPVPPYLAVGAGGCGRGDLSPTPQRALLRAGFARCGGGTRAPGGGASCLGVKRPGSGALPPPTARPLGGLPGPTTHWLCVRGGAGVGTRHQHHSARSCVLWGRHEGARGGRLLPGRGASGVGRSSNPDCPPSGRADGAHYPLAVGAAGCGRGDPSPTPQRALLRAGFARCGGGTRAPGGGGSCLGVGRLGTGALPPPTARPLGELPGPTTHWLWLRGGAGVGTRHQPHSARSCVLWWRHGGARGGRLLPGRGASGVGRSPNPNCPPSGRAAGAHYQLAVGAGGCGRGDPSPTPQRALLRAGFARCGGGTRAAGGGASCLGVGRPGSGALPPPTAGPLVGLPGPAPTGCGCGGVRAWGLVTNPTARALASGLCALWGRHEGARGGRLLPGCWGVRGRAPCHPRLPALWAGCRGPLPTGCGCGGVRAWGPVTNPTARALACCGGGMRVPGGGASCLGVGRPGSGALPRPTARPLGGLIGPTTDLLCVRRGAGVGTHHQPHSARSCELALRAVGAARGRPGGGGLLPGRGASGVGRSPTPDCPPSGRADGAHYPLAVGAAGCGRGDPSPTPQRALLRPGFARCGGGTRAPGGGASCLGVGRPGSGALPTPDCPPSGRAAGAHYPLAVGARGCGRGEPSPTPQRALLRAVGAAWGCPGGAPLAWVWGVRGRALAHPRLPALWAGCRGPLPTGCGCGGVRAWGPVTNPTARALASWLCALWGRHEGAQGGAPPAWVWGVRGRALSHPRLPALWAGCRGPLPTGCGCGGVRAWGPVTNPTARALASWLCALWGRHEGAQGGAPPAWVWGVRGRALSHPRLPALWAGCRGPLPTGCGCGGVRAWGPVTNPTARALACCGGGMRVPGGGACCLGVGRPGSGALPPPTARPLGGLPAPTTHSLPVQGACGRGGPSPTQQRALLRAGFARCGGSTRAPGGGASCLGVGRPGSGALPSPTARLLGGLPGPTTHWLWVRGGAGVGTRHQPHSARSCELALRAVGAARGRQGGAPPAWVWGVRGRALSHPRLPALWAGCRAHYPLAVGAGGCGRGHPSPTPQRALLPAVGAAWGCPGGAPLAWAWGVRGRALSHPRLPALWVGCRGPLPTGCGCGGVRACGPVTNPTARALASWLCALWGRHESPGGGASCLGVGRPGSGALPPPTARPLGGLPSPLPTGCGCRGVRAWGPVTNPTARALATWLCALWGRHEGAPGGAPPAWVWGVRGQALSHPRLPALLAGCRGPLPTGCVCGGVRAWGPVTNPTARALASWLCALWGQHEGARGGRLLPGFGASGVGRSPTPDCPPSGGCRGPLPTGCGCGGVRAWGPVTNPTARALACCGGGMRGPGGAPLAWVWGVRVRALSHPRLPALWAGCRGPLPTGYRCGGVWAWGPVTNPTARALATLLCALWGRHEGARGGRLLPGCGASGVGRSPSPDCPPFGRAAGAHYLLAVGAGGCGRGDPSPTPQRALLRAVGAA